MNDQISFEQLLDGYIKNQLSNLEKWQFLVALNNRNNIEILKEMVAGRFNITDSSELVYDRVKVDNMIQMIQSILEKDSHTQNLLPREITNSRMPPLDASPNENEPALFNNKKRKLFSLKSSWMRYAAIIVITTGMVVFYYANRSIVSTTSETSIIKDPVENGVLPGKDEAVLKLSTGRKVRLSADEKQTIKDGEVLIQNIDGRLTYEKTDKIAFNELITPRGVQYRIKLSDGTLVWLNAASSISYPTAFTGETRQVSITGEVYFEVFKDPLRPFIVKTYRDEIKVTGTSFNINSYTDEDDIKTSLLEGVVEINGIKLSPGKAYMGGKIIPANLERDLAWKNGVFNFHHVRLREVMRQLARWYDIEVKYEGSGDEVEMGGEIGRNLSLQQVLEGLQDKDLHFKLEGNVLTVY